MKRIEKHGGLIKPKPTQIKLTKFVISMIKSFTIKVFADQPRNKSHQVKHWEVTSKLDSLSAQVLSSLKI